MNKLRLNIPPKGVGRPKGSVNKTTAILKDAILKAATDAGNGDMAAYLAVQANANPGPFMSLLGKVLPLQLAGADGQDGLPGKIVIQILNVSNAHG